jgi:hypothetical protein
MKPRYLIVVAVVACAPKPEAAPEGAITTSYSALAVRNDSTLAAIRALEDTLRRDSTSAETPRRLYQLGHMIARNYLDLTRGLPDTAFMIGRDSSYFYNEIGGGYLYNGAHFKAIERRFPADTFAALGGFAVAFLPEGGECEGYVACYMSRGFEPLAEFLRKHARSRLAAEAIDSINVAWTRSLQFADSVKRMNPEWVDTTDMRSVMLRYDSTAARLPAELRERAYASLRGWLEAFGLKPLRPPSPR